MGSPAIEERLPADGTYARALGYSGVFGFGVAVSVFPLISLIG